MAPVPSRLCRLADAILPAAVAAGDPRRRRRGRMLALLTPATALLLVGAAAIAAARVGGVAIARAYLAFGAALLGLWIALWRGCPIARAGHLFTGLLLAVAATALAASSGSEASGFTAACLLATVPVLGVMLTGPTGGSVWGTLAALAAAALAGGPAPGSIGGTAAARALAVLVVLGIALAYSRLEEAALAECERERERAERAHRAKGEMVAHLSHEIRSPLDVAVGMTDMLLETDLTEEQTSLARTARSASERTLSLVNDILDLARLEAGRMPIASRRFDLRSLLAEATRPHAMVARRKGIDLSLRVDERVPAEVVGDPGRLHQVVTNLLSNAVKFTERGSARIAAQPLDSRAGWIRIEVRDTGIGIAAEDLPRLFEPFVQSGRPSGHERAGSGLGLAIAHQLVSLMGGRLHVESRPGEGSRFSLDLPLAERRPGATLPRSPAPSRAA